MSARSSLDSPAGPPLSGPALLRAMRRYAACLTVGAIIFAALAYVVSLKLPTRYDAQAQLILGNPADVTIFSTQAAANPIALSLGAAQVLRSQQVTDRAKVILKQDGLAGVIGGTVTVTPADSSPVISISASAPKAKRAQGIANAVAQAYLDVKSSQYAARGKDTHQALAASLKTLQGQLRSVQTQLAARANAASSLATVSNITLPVDRARYIQSALASDSQYQALVSRQTSLSASIGSLSDRIEQTDVDNELLRSGVDHFVAARLPHSKASPNTKRNVGIGLVVGLLIGAAFAWRLTQRNQTVDPLLGAEALGAPLLGRVSRDRRLRRVGELIDFSADSRIGNEIKVLTSSVMLSAHRLGIGALVVTSAHSREGKSVLASNIAAAGESGGHPVLLVDANPRNRDISHAFGLDQRAGLDDLFAGGSLSEAITTVRYGDDRRLLVMPAGVQGLHPRPGRRDEVAVSTWGSPLSNTADPSRVAVVDAPAVNEDPLALQLATGAAMVIVTSPRTTLTDLEVIRNRAHLAGVPVLGFILNECWIKGRRPWSKGVRKAAAVEQIEVDLSKAPAIVNQPATANPSSS